MKVSRRRRYQRRLDSAVIAVRLSLKTDGLTYRKWGARQRAKAGDWLVDNGGDVYTIDARVFARTYKPVKSRPGAFVKTTAVWAERATKAGAVKTKEGATHYRAGDYIVSNSRHGDEDTYAVSAKKFKSLYKPARKG